MEAEGDSHKKPLEYFSSDGEGGGAVCDVN